MGETVSSEVAKVAAATGSKDAEVALGVDGRPGPPLLAVRTLQFARVRADGLGHGRLGPELLLSVLDDLTRPWPRCISNRWRRRLLAHLGLPKGYRGAARPLLDAFGVELDELRDAVVAHLQGVPR